MTGSPARDRRTPWWWLVAACAVGVALVTAGCAAQPETAQAGTVEFGTSGTGCTIEGPASSFPSGEVAIYDVAHFAREVSTGEVITFRVLQDGKELAAVPRAFAAAGDCLGGALPVGLPPAHYRIELLAGSELLAAGEFDVGP